MFIALVAPGVLKAQEVKYIDISRVVARTELRHPPAPRQECKGGTNCIGVGGGSGGGSVTDGAPDQRDPHALGIYLLRVTPTEINPAEPFQVEFKILNTGMVPIELPVSPDLADLQPGDESAAFSYSSLAVVVRGEVESWRAEEPLGFVELFGSADGVATGRMDSGQREREANYLATGNNFCAFSRRVLVAKEYVSSATRWRVR